MTSCKLKEVEGLRCEKCLRTCKLCWDWTGARFAAIENARWAPGTVRRSIGENVLQLASIAEVHNPLLQQTVDQKCRPTDFAEGFARYFPNRGCVYVSPRELARPAYSAAAAAEFFNHYKDDLKRHAHTPSGVAGADLKSQAGGALGTPTLLRLNPPVTYDTPTQP